MQTSSIAEKLKSKKVTVSFEIFPPKKQAGFESVRQTALDLASLNPDFISITYGAGGTTQSNTAELASLIEKNGVSALAHLTCVRLTKKKLEENIAAFKSQGIKNILALRGDMPRDINEGEDVFPSGFSHASNLITLLKKEGFCVGGACYPEGHPESANRDEDIDKLKEKVEAGADFLTTQMFFDNDMLYSFLYRMQSAGIHVPVLAGIMPITNSSQVSKMVDLSNAYIPRRLLSICDKFRSSPDAMRQAGIAYATEQIIDLISNGVRGIHIYTMNKPEIARAIMRNIDSIIAATNGQIGA